MSLVSVSQEKIRETFVKNGLEVISPALAEKKWTGVPTWLLEVPSRPVFHKVIHVKIKPNQVCKNYFTSSLP